MMCFTDIQLKNLKIELDDIIKVFINFSTHNPALNFFIYSERANEIKGLLALDYIGIINYS